MNLNICINQKRDIQSHGDTMKIIDILKQDKMSLSFEVFPPKKETSFEKDRKSVV